jgi:hypothetical protein
MVEDDKKKGHERGEGENDTLKAWQMSAQDILPAMQAWGPAEREQAAREWEAVLRTVATGEDRRVRLRGSVAARRQMGKNLIFFSVAERRLAVAPKRGNSNGERAGAHGRGAQQESQRLREIEVLCDISRWQGEGDFYVETSLLRTETELELEGVCGVSERRGEPCMLMCPSLRSSLSRSPPRALSLCPPPPRLSLPFFFARLPFRPTLLPLLIALSLL